MSNQGWKMIFWKDHNSVKDLSQKCIKWLFILYIGIWNTKISAEYNTSKCNTELNASRIWHFCITSGPHFPVWEIVADIWYFTGLRPRVGGWAQRLTWSIYLDFTCIVDKNNKWYTQMHEYIWWKNFIFSMLHNKCT